MKASSMYGKLAKVAVTATLVASAMVVSTASQARPHYAQDVQYVQGGAQLVITAPQLVIQAPVYAAPPVTYERHISRPPAIYAPVVAPVVVPAYGPVYGPRYVRGYIYYIDGRPYLNGYPYYRRHGHRQHIDHHHVRHGGKHDHGRHLGHYK
jgi:hypothetical protein